MFNTQPTTETYEELVGKGQLLARSQDKCMWGLGELGSRVQSRYGERDFELYAKEIGIPVKRLYSYTRVYTFYNGFSACGEYPEFPYWSHYREAMRLDKSARRALEKCADRHWSVEKFGVFISRYLRMFGADPQPVTPTVKVEEWSSEITAVYFDAITIKLPQRYLNRVKSGMRVKVVLE